MLVFQVFANYYRFPKIDENSRLKVLEKNFSKYIYDIRIRKHMTKSLINISKKEF